jgi:hypothetical protein
MSSDVLLFEVSQARKAEGREGGRLAYQQLSVITGLPCRSRRLVLFLLIQANTILHQRRYDTIGNTGHTHNFVSSGYHVVQRKFLKDRDRPIRQSCCWGGPLVTNRDIAQSDLEDINHLVQTALTLSLLLCIFPQVPMSIFCTNPEGVCVEVYKISSRSQFLIAYYIDLEEAKRAK